MSIEAISWVLNDAPEVPPSLVSTLIGIANHAAANGRSSYPSQPTLAKYTRKTTRQVRRDLSELVRLGLIRKGDQRIVEHLPPDRRPVVYDLAMDLDGRTSTSARSSTSARTSVTERPDTHVRTDRTSTSAKPSNEPTTEPSTGGSLDRSSSGSRRASEDDDPTIDQTITETLHAATGRTITPEWAARVRRQILAGRNPADPRAYVAAAIRGEPRRFLPTNGDPSSRSLTEALAAARGEL